MVLIQNLEVAALSFLARDLTECPCPLQTLLVTWDLLGTSGLLVLWPVAVAKPFFVSLTGRLATFCATYKWMCVF